MMGKEDSQHSFYTKGGIKSGLTYDSDKFYLNGKPFQILSGSLHYFRLPQESWRESIKKMKHCHLNTVCTYIPWNLHEDEPGKYNYRHNLDLKLFIDLVKAEDMFLILRPGPYICAEVDLGGLPSWLLKDKDMKLRSTYAPYLSAVKRYFSEIIPLVKHYQFSLHGGPIIAVQVENEFGSFGDTKSNADDYEYMNFVKTLLIDLGIKELLFTCDMPSVSLLKGTIPGVLMTGNFQTDAEKELQILKNLQPDKPLMVAEFWSGWFDHWGDNHETVPENTYVESLKAILNHGASFNIYVLQGGTNYAFSNGANIGFPTPESPYKCTITSYDYDALLSESGECTKKYFATSALLQSFGKECPKVDLLLEANSSYLSMENIPVTKFLSLNKMLSLSQKHQYSDPVVMEEVGQRFGFTLYETSFDESGTLKFKATQGLRIMVFVNYNIISVLENAFGYQSVHLIHAFEDKPSMLWVLVENLGRVNFTEEKSILNNERRGIFGSVELNAVPLKNWTIYTLDFNEKFIGDISSVKWEEGDSLKSATFSSKSVPGLYAATFSLKDVKDTFVHSFSWNKGIVIINGFNIGRYWKIGPQQTLFVSKHLLKEGLNEIIVFELHNCIDKFILTDKHILDVTKQAD